VDRFTTALNKEGRRSNRSLLARARACAHKRREGVLRGILDQGSIKKRDIIIARGARGRPADDKWMSSPDELRQSAVRLELTEEDGSLELINELIGASDRPNVQPSREPFFIQLYG